MQEIIFTNEELNELLVVLNVAMEDANTVSHRSHDMQEIEAYTEHKQMIRKWIHRFSQLIKDAKQSSEPETKLHNLEKPWLPIQPGEEF